jgi:AAA ATPase domain
VLDVNVWTNHLIGRDRELAVLGSLLDEAVVDGATLLLTGEPGVGKTALLAAAAEMAATAGFEVIRGGGVEYETDVSFAGLHQLVGPLSDDLRRLPRSSRVAMEVALGLGSGPAPERLAGSWPASFPASGESMPTRAWSPPPCGASPTKRATSRRPRASCPPP